MQAREQEVRATTGDAGAGEQDSPAQSLDGFALLERLRPDVSQAHAALLRRLGSSLPPSTRQLIFLALCVVRGSDRGLRRHASRALATGSSADHVVDAVLMTIPVAGVARVADALEVVHEILAHAPRVEDAGQPHH